MDELDVVGHSNKIWEILDQITGDPSLSVLEKLNEAILGFAEYAESAPTKLIKSFINAGNNAEGLAELIRECMLIDYKTTSMHTANLLAALGFKNSPLLVKLRENGGQAILSRHIIVYKQNNYVSVIQKLSNQELSNGLLRAFFTNFHAKKCHIIPLLIENGVNSIFVEEFVKSLRPEHILDSISIVHALTFIIDEAQYRERLHLEELMLELVKDQKMDSLFDFKSEDVKLNKVDVEKEKNELEALKKRLKILQISLEEIERNVEVIHDELQQNKNLLSEKRDILSDIKNAMITLEEQINDKNASPAQLEALQSNYRGVQNVYIESERELSETEEFVSECVIRLKQKEQDKSKLLEMRQQISEQQTQIENIIDSEQGGQECIENNKHHTNTQEATIYDINNYQTIKFSQVVFCQLIKQPEGLKYFCNTPELGYLFALRFSQLRYSPQLVGSLEFVLDLLLIETPVRNNILLLLEGKPFKEYITNDLSLFGAGISVPLLANLINNMLDESQENLTYIYMFLDQIEKINMQEYIATSFVGYKSGQNFAITYLLNALNRFMEIGLFEAVICEILAKKDAKLVKCFTLLAAYVLFLVKLFNQDMYLYIQETLSTASKGYENKYSKHEQLIQCCQTLIAASKNSREAIDLNIEEHTLYLSESMHQMSNRFAETYRLPVFARMLDWNLVNIENYPAEPLKWNWEEINFFANNQLTDQFIRGNKAHLMPIVQFVANKTHSYAAVKEQAPWQFVINSPIPGFKFDNNKFEVYLKEAHLHSAFLQLPMCAQTVRIQQICVNFIAHLIFYKAGVELVDGSSLMDFLCAEAGKLVDMENYPLQQARIVISLIGAISQSCCGVEMLQQAKVIDQLYKIVYGSHISQEIISEFIMCTAPASEQCVDRWYGEDRPLCSCGEVCLRQSAQSDLKLTILAFLKSSDVRIRYQGLIRLAQLLRKREFYLHTKLTPCKCLCYGCAKIEQEQLLLNEEDASWALSCLMPLMNDVQAEIAIAALCVVEEFISKQDIHLFIENEIDLKNWKNTGHFLQMRLAQTPEGRNFIGRDEIMALMDQKYIYRYTHNLEYKQFLSLTRQISANLKYPSYDKIVIAERNSVDFEFTLQDQYAYDIIVLPHNTPFGRAALELPESLENIPVLVRTSFWQDRSTYLQPTTFSSSQSYSRGNIFECLNCDADGLTYIKASGIVIEISQNLLLPVWKAESVLFRGYIIAFCEISSTNAGFSLFPEGKRIFDAICEMAVACQVERCRYTCFWSLQILAKNAELRALLCERFVVRDIQLRNFRCYLVTLKADDASIVYNRTERTKEKIFGFNKHNIDFVTSVQLTPDLSHFYTQPAPLYTGNREESGILLQSAIKTNFSALRASGITYFLNKNKRRDITNQFATQIEMLRGTHQRVDRQHLSQETQQAVKLCFVDNVADAQSGLLALRQGYQKNYQLDCYILLEISKRHVEPFVLDEIYSIIGNIDLGALEWLDSFQGEWI